MDAFGNMLLIAMPMFLVLIIAEQLYGWFSKKEKPRIMDSVSSISSGMTNILKSTLGLSIIIISYPWVLSKIALFSWPESSFWPYVITFVFMDFAGYWEHRLNHRVNFFWNHHVIHHSSEEFNLPCALRQQISVFTNLYTFLLLPMALIGIAPVVLAIVGPIHLFSQFWYHTRYINKMGVLEHILVTPSHHRVHHAMNDLYMDKNYGQIFIIWDKLFGTFQEELLEEPCIYGVRRPAQTWNPFIINFQHLWLLIKDAARTKSWTDKLRIWFMPTGWRPADVESAYPEYYIKDIKKMEKYNPDYSPLFQAWGVVNLSVIFALICFLFYRFGEIDKSQALVYGLFLLAGIFAFSAFMDKKLYGLIAMLVVALGALAFYLQSADWFGLKDFWSIGPLAVVAFFCGTAVWSVYLYQTEFEETGFESAVSG